MSTTWSFAWKRLRSLWTIADLRNKILFTLGLLLIYRVLAHILVPLTHQEQVNLVNLFGSNKSQNLGQLLGLLDVQPAKLAAMEGVFHTEKGAPIKIGGIVDDKTGQVLCMPLKSLIC